MALLEVLKVVSMAAAAVTAVAMAVAVAAVEQVASEETGLAMVARVGAILDGEKVEEAG